MKYFGSTTRAKKLKSPERSLSPSRNVTVNFAPKKASSFSLDDEGRKLRVDAINDPIHNSISAAALTTARKSGAIGLGVDCNIPPSSSEGRKTFYTKFTQDILTPSLALSAEAPVSSPSLASPNAPLLPPLPSDALILNVCTSEFMRPRTFQFLRSQYVWEILDEIYREMDLPQRVDMGLYLPPPKLFASFLCLFFQTHQIFFFSNYMSIFNRDEWCLEENLINHYGLDNGSKVLYIEKPDRMRTHVTLHILLHQSARYHHSPLCTPPLPLSLPMRSASHCAMTSPADGTPVDVTMTVCRKESVGHVILLLLQQSCPSLSHTQHYGLFSLRDSSYLSPSLSLEAAAISSQSRLLFRLLPSAPLPLALLRCDEESVIEYLEACSNYDVVDETGRNLLHLASERDEGAIIIRYLLKKNVDVNHRDSLGRTPVMISALKGSLKAVRLYVRSGLISLSLSIYLSIYLSISLAFLLSPFLQPPSLRF
jgi:hypothetical protein